MSKPYTIIQCSNYFEYMNFKDNFNVSGFTIEYANNTYTIKVHNSFAHFNRIPKYVKQHAPTATITQVSFRNNRATYTKLKA